MFNLANIIALKIVVTLSCWSFPLLVAPGFFLPQAGLAWPANTILLSLLGWAYVALCVGYGYGFLQARKGVREKGIITLGGGQQCRRLPDYAVIRGDRHGA